MLSSFGNLNINILLFESAEQPAAPAGFEWCRMWLPSTPCPGGGLCVSVVCLCLALSIQRLAEPGIPQPENAYVTLILCMCIGLPVCVLLGTVSSRIWQYSDGVNAWKCDVGKAGGDSKIAAGKDGETKCLQFCFPNVCALNFLTWALSWTSCCAVFESAAKARCPVCLG